MLKDIYDVQFLTLYADESENASHKETFPMFVTYLSSTEQKITTFLGIVILKERRQQKSQMLFKSFLQQNL